LSPSSRADATRLGRILRRARDERGLSRPALAELSNVPADTITKIELASTADAGFFTIGALCAALSLDVDDVHERAVKPTGLLSIGYEGRSSVDLIRSLDDQKVAYLVDIRLNPISRKPGLSKTALASACDTGGLHYIHLRDLGNPKDNRDGFPGPDNVAAHTFRALTRRGPGRAAIAHIANLATHANVAILCFERDEANCHRSVVIQEVMAMRSDILHIAI